MRCTLSQCLATAAVLSVVAPAGAHAHVKPAKNPYKANPAVLKQVKAAYAVFRAPKRKTDVVTGVAGMPKAEQRRIARAESRYLGSAATPTGRPRR